MKYLFFILIYGVLTLAGSVHDRFENNFTDRVESLLQKKDVIHITDHHHFDITFYEVGFNKWLAKQKPMDRYYESSLEIENLQYADEWNRRVANPDLYDHSLYSQKIDYRINPKKRYGLEMNYLLYQYFRFFEIVHEQLLLK